MSKSSVSKGPSSKSPNLKSPTLKSTVSSQAKALLDGGEAKKAVLATSKDRARRERLITKYIAKFFQEQESIERVDCRFVDASRLKAIETTVDSLSLFSRRKLFLFRYVDELAAAEVKRLTDIIKESSEDNFFLLEAAPLPEKNTLVQVTKKIGVYLPFPELKGPELKRWMAKEAQLSDIKELSVEAQELLLTIADDDLDKLSHAINLLSLYAGDAAIGKKEIFELFKASLHINDFELSELSLGKQTSRARLLLSESLHEGGNPFGILSILSRLSSQVAVARFELDSGRSLPQIRDTLNLSPWQFNKVSNFAQRNSHDDLRKKLYELLKADSRLKNRSVHIVDILDGAL